MRRSERGLTLIELIVAFTILAVLTSMAMPMARMRVRREKERELRLALREIHTAIDKYKDMADRNELGPQKLDTNGYPENLEMLVEGVKAQGAADKKIRFLRRIPRDPMTNSTEWGMRSDRDEPSSESWGGQNVFQVFSKSKEVGSDGKPYSEW